ncbi:MAG: PorV/PorQ family protein [bacterium]
MKRIFYKLLVPCLVLLLLTSVNGIAQEKRVGTNAASELLIPVGARYIAMGGASLALVKGVEAIYWNPAGLTLSDYTADAMFSHMSYIADMKLNYVAVAAKFGGLGSLGFSIKSLDIGDIVVTTEEFPDGTGALFSPQFIVGGLTYSRALSDRVSVGATLNVISEDIERVSARSFAFDIGVQYRNLANINGLNVAVVVKNIGPSMKYSGTGLLRRADAQNVDRSPGPLAVEAQRDELPSVLEIGASYTFTMGENSKINVMGLFQDNNFTDDVARLGAEYDFNDLFFVRAGYSLAPDAADEDLTTFEGQNSYIYGLTLGAGIHYDFPKIAVTIDYAYRDVDFFESNNVFQIRLGF